VNGQEVFPGHEGLFDFLGGSQHDFGKFGLPDPGAVVGSVMDVVWPGLVTIAGILIGFKVVTAVYAAIAGRR